MELVAARQDTDDSEPTETDPITSAATETESSAPVIPPPAQEEQRDFVLLESIGPAAGQDEDEDLVGASEPTAGNVLIVASEASSVILPAEEETLEISSPTETSPIEPAVIDEAINEVADEVEVISAGGFLLSLFSSRQD